MASIQEPFLATGYDGECPEIGEPRAVQNKNKTFYMKRGLVVAGVCLGAAAMIEAVSYHRKAIFPEYFADVRAGWGEAKCYKFTGGTCFFNKCNEDRKATCSGAMCICETGCTGADGKCVTDINEYEAVASNVHIKNFYWKDQYLYAARTWFMEQLRTTSSPDQYADRWNIYRVPGDMWAPWGAGNWSQFGGKTGETAYILSPVEFPEYATGISNTKMEIPIPIPKGKNDKGSQDIATIPVGSLYIIDMFHLTSRHLLANMMPFNPGAVFQTFCRPQSGALEGAIRIDGAYGAISWYEHTASWEVFGWIWSDPKEGGYWSIEGLPDDEWAQFPVCK